MNLGGKGNYLFFCSLELEEESSRRGRRGRGRGRGRRKGRREGRKEREKRRNNQEGAALLLNARARQVPNTWGRCSASSSPH